MPSPCRGHQRWHKADHQGSHVPTADASGLHARLCDMRVVSAAHITIQYQPLPASSYNVAVVYKKTGINSHSLPGQYTLLVASTPSCVPDTWKETIKASKICMKPLYDICSISTCPHCGPASMVVAQTAAVISACPAQSQTLQTVQLKSAASLTKSLYSGHITVLQYHHKYLSKYTVHAKDITHFRLCCVTSPAVAAAEVLLP